MKRKILATGGAGYIGSHVVVELLEAGHDVVILDNFENSHPDVVNRIEQICGTRPGLAKFDLCDRDLVLDLFREKNFDAVVHFAGKKAVGESVADPLLYFDCNLGGALSLLSAMRQTGVRHLVFSSSATVYGIPETLPISEAARTGVTNPYGRTKLMIEEMIDDLSVSWPELRAISMRYFNPVGAHASGLIGEDPNGMPNNLFPIVAQVAAGLRDKVSVFGGDFDTVDGTGLRDYIHVADLARGHVAAIEKLLAGSNDAPGHRRVNLGTGRGYSVLEVIQAFSSAASVDIPYDIVARRPGDAAASVADPAKAEELFGWKARHDLPRMCRDHWAFQVNARALKGAAQKTSADALISA
jgi:UDP-glucose 4-epimerase